MTGLGHGGAKSVTNKKKKVYSFNSLPVIHDKKEEDDVDEEKLQLLQENSPD